MALDLKRTAFLLTIGPVCIMLAGVLEWWASPATMTLTRTGPGTVSVLMVTRLFARWPTVTTQYDEVRSVAIVTSPNRQRETDSDRLVFFTASESIDRTRAQQLFRPDFVEIKEFMTDESSRTLTLSSIARLRELWRYIAAQAATLFLTLLGAGVIWLAVREIRQRNRDVLIRGVDY